MQAIARIAIFAFIFTIPWENMIVFPGFGTISRLTGMVAFGFGLAAFFLKPQIRNLTAFHIVFLIFVMYSANSYWWSLDPITSMERINSYLQLVLFVWLLWQFVETEMHILNCMQAYMIGAVVGSIGTIVAWMSGIQSDYLRYSAEGFDPNELSVILAIAIPVAWYLSLRYSSFFLVWLNRSIIPLLWVAILLTSSRTGLIVASVGTLFIIVSLAQGSMGTKIAFAIVALATVFIIPQLIPDSTWQRMGTVESEIVSGTLGNRTMIWAAGIDIWFNNLAFGVGTGAFNAAAILTHGFGATCHNTYLQILVELGATGLMIFAGLMFVIWRKIQLLPVLERRLYLIVCAVLVLGISTLTWETKKPVWLLCSLILSHAVVLAKRKDEESNETEIAEEPVSRRLLQVKSERPLLQNPNGICNE